MNIPTACTVMLPAKCRKYLKSDLALASLPLPPVQVHHKCFVTVLPVQSHALVSLTEGLDLVLLHIRDDLRREGQNYTPACESNNELKYTDELINHVLTQHKHTQTHIFVKVHPPFR